MSLSNDVSFDVGKFSKQLCIPVCNNIATLAPTTGAIAFDLNTNKLYIATPSGWALMNGAATIQYSIGVLFRSLSVSLNSYISINGSGWFSTSGSGNNNIPVNPANEALEYTWIAPHNGTMSNFAIYVDRLPDAGDITFTLIQCRPSNMALNAPSYATQLTVTFTTSSSRYQTDNTHIVSFLAGDIFSYRSTPSDPINNTTSLAGTASIVITKT